jgi:hypothetical protein
MLHRRCKLSMGKADLRGSADWKPLDRSIPNFELITAILTSCYKPTFITIAPRGSSAQYGEIVQILFTSIFHFLSRPVSGTRRSICQAYASNDVVCDKEVPFGVPIDKNFFRVSTPSPKFSEGILHANRKSRITFDRREIDAKFQNRSIPTQGQEMIGDLTSGLARPLAAEIVFPPFSPIRKAHIKSKRCTITCSALALSTVSRTTSLSYGNMPFSGTHPTKTPWPIVLKFCTVDNFGETTKHAKNGYNRMKTYQFKHSVKDDQIIRQKLQISILLILEMVLHVIWYGASVDAK